MYENFELLGREELCNRIYVVVDLYKNANEIIKGFDTDLNNALQRAEKTKDDNIASANTRCKSEKDSAKKNTEVYLQNRFINKKNQYCEKNNELLRSDETYNYLFSNDNFSYDSYDSFDLARLEEVFSENEKGFINSFNYALNNSSAKELDDQYLEKCRALEKRLYGEADTPFRLMNEMSTLSEKLLEKSPHYYKIYNGKEVSVNADTFSFSELCEGIIARYEEVSKDDLLNKYAISPKRRGARESKRDFERFAGQIKEAYILFDALNNIIKSRFSSEKAVLTQERDEVKSHLIENYNALRYYYKNMEIIVRRANEKALLKIAEDEKTIEAKINKIIEEYKQDHKKRCDDEKVNYRTKINDYLKEVSEQLDDLLPDSLLDKYVSVRDYLRGLRSRFNISSEEHFYQMFSLDLEKMPDSLSKETGEEGVLNVFKNKFSAGFNDLPFIWTDSDRKSLLVRHDNNYIKKAHEMVCSVILDFLSLVKIGNLSINIIDKAYNGKSVSSISEGLDKVPELINYGIKTEDQEITETIDRLYEISEGHVPSDKKELLIVSGYPCGIDEQADSKLNSIFNSKNISTVLFINTEQKRVNTDSFFGNKEEEEKKLIRSIMNYEHNALIIEGSAFSSSADSYLSLQGADIYNMIINWPRLPDKHTLDNYFMAYAVVSDIEHICEPINLNPIKKLLMADDEKIIDDNIENIRKIKNNNDNVHHSFPRSLEIGEMIFECGFFSGSFFYHEICNRLFTDDANGEDNSRCDDDVAISGSPKLSFPLEFDLSKTFGLFIDNNCDDNVRINEITNYIVWSFFKTMPKGKSKIVVFDSIKRGENIRELLELREKLPEVFTIDTVIQKKKETLNGLNALIDDRIQKKLFGSNNDIYDYNDRSEKTQEKITILIIYDYPEHTDDAEYMKQLEGVLQNGAKCGIITVFCINNENEYTGTLKDNISKVREKCLCIYCKNEGSYLSSYGIKINPYKLPSYEEIHSYIDDYTEEYTAVKNKGILFDDIRPAVFFERSATDGLSIPMGIGGGDSVVELAVGGEEDSHHGLIIGGTGSGKSTLLHTIIMGGITHYGPDELNLYLLDFKSGTEFKIYEEYKIPHIKYLGLDAMQEYGVGVLEGLKNEMNDRADKFKDVKVSSISEYNKLEGVKQLPRILILIDEFQILFDQGSDYKLASEAGGYATDIIKIGRSFGLHLIMATQSATSIRHGLSIDKGTIDQMRLRIALSCSEEDAKYMFGDDSSGFNDALVKMSGPKGTAVVNLDIMNKNVDNIGFRVSYCDNESKSTILNEVEQKVLHEFPEIKCDMHVFDANKKKDFTDFCTEKDIRENDEKGYVQIYIGEPIRMSDPCVITMDNKNNRSLMICGTNEDMRNDITDNVIISALLNRNSEVFCIDGNAMINDPVSDYYSVYKEYFGDRFRYACCEEETFEFVKQIYDICERRFKDTEEPDEKDRKYFLILRNFQYLDDFHEMFKGGRVPEDRYDKFLNDNSDNPFGDVNTLKSQLGNTVNMDQKIETIIMRGRRKGIYTVIDCDDSRIINDTMRNNKYIDEFKEKVLFMEDDSLAGNDVKMSNLKYNMAYHLSSGQPHIIKPFGNPGDKESLREFFESVKMK